MRFELTFTRVGKQRMLPMDYQYYISAWVYKVLRQADSEFAKFLHEKGYGNSEVKLYKLFCFSRLSFGRPVMWKDKGLFEINKREIHLQLAFDVHEIVGNFIKGLFMLQDFYLGDKFNGIDFKVSNVEGLTSPAFLPVVRYQLQSPWVVSIQPEGRKHAKYLSPDDSDFEELAVKHIAEKYKSTRLEEPGDISLKITTPFKRSGFLLKPGTKEETRVVGNIFDFELAAAPAVHQMIWNAGISEKSASGFGWVEVPK
ncbi:CRISPR-associated endoribonuclease Cas6 [Geofilum rubicundum]|uniref:CRISPR-associated endoribonuclease n=1 Tax=Geofilum rubicundum JCM 15548 TaxID=1236989 RepID=A0A0E9LSR6_9BACT|nr:CRISPR-associated endoribonuclease Cas6 [Geofilum rubicundum]GAO28622.1 CRISPR repeat RNA endoribonuclease Cas6 [Geofilum rubicundum JCM 15548]